MSWREDRDEFNNTGWRGMLRRGIPAKREIFIKLAPGGWIGTEVAERPAPGSGPYIHWQQGDHVWLYSNETAEDTRREMVPLEV